MYHIDEKIVEVIEVIGDDNVKPYTNAGWIVLGVVTRYDLNEGYFVYSLGRPESVPKAPSRD